MATTDPAFDIVAQLEVADEGFGRDLKKAEKAVAASATGMTASMAKATTSSVSLSGGLAAAGAAGTLAGSAFGGVASAASGMAGAISALGLSLGPVTIALGAIALVVFSFRDSLFSATDESEKLKESTEALTSRIEKSADAFNLQAKATTAAALRIRDLRKEQADAATDPDIESGVRRPPIFNVFGGDQTRLPPAISKTQQGIEIIIALETETLELKEAQAIETKLIADINKEIEASISSSNALRVQAAARESGLVAQRETLRLQIAIETKELSIEEVIRLTNDADTARLRIRLLHLQTANRELVILKQQRDITVKASESISKRMADTPAASFTIGTTASSLFQGFTRGSNIVIGQQTKQEKTNTLLEENNRILTRISEIETAIVAATEKIGAIP